MPILEDLKEYADVRPVSGGPADGEPPRSPGRVSPIRFVSRTTVWSRTIPDGR